MNIILHHNMPIESYPYLEVGTGLNQDGLPNISHQRLPIYVGKFDHDTSEVDYLIICSDLQGAVEINGNIKLLGEELPAFLRLFLEIEQEATPDSKIGVLLCGDFYTSLEKRGSSGDVRQVWLTFLNEFDWVIGVAGNHDRFGKADEKEAFISTEHLYLLHKEVKRIDGLAIGGISGIIGRGDKTNRVDEQEYLEQLKSLLDQELDFVLLHETPDYPIMNYIGNPKIRTVIETASKSNICCGHCYWDTPLVEFENQSRIINVDSKVLILKKDK